MTTSELIEKVRDLIDEHWGCTTLGGDLEAGCSLWIDLVTLLGHPDEEDEDVDEG